MPLVLTKADMAVAVVELGMPKPNPSPPDANAAEAVAAGTELLADGLMAAAATRVPCPKDGVDAVKLDGQGLYTLRNDGVAVAGVGPETPVSGTLPFADADGTTLEVLEVKKLQLAGLDMTGTGAPKLTVRVSAGEDKAGPESQ